MKTNNVLKNAVIPLALLVSLSSFAAFADDENQQPEPGKSVTVNGGTLKFQGSLVNAPCAVDSPKEGHIVDLGQYRTAEFDKEGDTSVARRFEIKLSNCAVETYKKAQVTFLGHPVEGKDTVLALEEGSSSARGVGIQILSGGNAVPVDGSKPSGNTDLIQGNTTMVFSAQYISTNKDIKPGAANASADFSITYL